MTDRQASSSSKRYDTTFRMSYLKPVYWPTWLLIGVLYVMRFVPVSIQDRLANGLGQLAYKLNAKRRRIAGINIDLCFPSISKSEKDRLIKNNFRHQARSALHYGLLWWAGERELDRRIQLHGIEHVNACRNKERPMIIMAAHSLGLEMAVTMVSRKYQVTGPFKPMKNALVDWMVARGRVRFGTYIYPREAGLRPVIKDVNAGAILFYLPDEDLGANRSIFVPFYGELKATVPVLGRLAKRCQAEVIPCVACYDERDHRYHVHFLPAIEGMDGEDDMQDATLMNQSLQQLVDICPEQYFWTMKLFKTRPEGEKNPYNSTAT